jgi:hypothetical protein
VDLRRNSGWICGREESKSFWPLQAPMGHGSSGTSIYELPDDYDFRAFDIHTVKIFVIQKNVSVLLKFIPLYEVASLDLFLGLRVDSQHPDSVSVSGLLRPGYHAAGLTCLDRRRAWLHL